MACPRRVGVPQGRAGGSWHVLVARETGTASGWKQSKEDRPAFTVAGQHARVRNQALCEAPGATTPSRFYYDISFGTPPLQDWQAIFGSGGVGQLFQGCLPILQCKILLVSHRAAQL